MNTSEPTAMNRRLPKLLAAAALLTAAFLYWSFLYQPAMAEPRVFIGKGTSYDKEWKRVDSLAAKGLYQSALDLSNQIYARAKAENNNPQIVKALIHRFKFSQTFQENSEDLAIYDLQKELKTAKFPLAPMLHSMLGDLYWQYYNQNRWKFYERSQTVGFKNDSINTWDLAHLTAAAVKEYQLSLSSPDSLKKLKVDAYEEVINKGSADARPLRPTMYDFLAHKAIDFFSGDEPAITRPADKFVIDDPRYFASAREFAKLDLSTADTMAFKFFALKHLQGLVKLHLEDQNVNALVDDDLKRLMFLRANCVLPEKDSLYESALRQLGANNPDCPYTADVYFQLAQYENQLGDSYVPGKDEKNHFAKKEAVKICDAAFRKFPNTQGADNCISLRNSILAKDLSFTTEGTVVPGQPSRALLSWENISKVYFRLVKMDEELHDTYDNRTTEEIMRDYLRMPVLLSWDLALPNDSDYQQHSAEIKIPAVAHGHYLLLASAYPEFPLVKSGIAYGMFWSSSYSFIDRQTKDGGYEYYLLNRQTGAPVPGVTAQLWIHKYDYGYREYRYHRGDKYTTDKDGHFAIPAATDYRNILVEFTGKDDHLYTGETYQYRPYRNEQRMQPKTFFFTDRAIYRPGQTVYFKGIMIETDGSVNNLLKNRSTTVTFYDANYQQVKQLNLVTNDYGSFSGSFVAPSSGLTGQMHIGNESGSDYFSVEEYKRPKFEVNTDPVKGAYRLNDSIRVKGTAKMYAGSVVDGAEVKYRVVRTASYPWWWFCWRGYYPSSGSTEITNGTTTTNDTGGFVIPFKALPDRSVPAESQPTFNYTVYVDVTDITGETHSTSAYVNVGYVALNLAFEVPEYVEKSANDSVYVSLTNLSGEPDSAVVSYTIRKLNAPDHALRDRQWGMPDKFIYTKADWQTWFPDDPYADENERSTWAKGETVASGTINTGKMKSIRFRKNSWSPGVYVLEANTKDKYGVDVKDLRYFTLYDIKDKTPATKDNFSWQAIKTNCQPGEKAIFLLGTSEKDVTVLYETEQDQKIISKEWMKLSNEQKYIEIPVEEKHRGNFSVHFAFVHHNRAYIREQQVYVPWKSKQLDIQFETYRNKMLPGSKEEWKLKIKGPDGEKVAAEMVAAMYDASLDEFRANSWDFYLYQSYYSSLYWQRGVESTVSSNLFSRDWNSYSSYYYRTYESLNWFGYYYSYRNYYWGYKGDTRIYDGDELQEKPMDAPAPPDEDAPKTKDVTVSESKAVGGAKKAEGNASYAWTPATGATTTLYDKNTNDEMSEQQAVAGKEQDNRKASRLNDIKARTNLNETVFFFPQLETDSTGTVIIKFTMNEALTKWKFMAFAHTKDLKYGQVTKEVITQKDLMVMPNAPRFLREKDQITFTAKVSNLTDKEVSGTAQLMLFDALSMTPIDGKLLVSKAQVPFTAKKGQSAPLSWDLTIPEGIGAVQYRVVASAGNFTDGEEAALPVLSNRMLVTETMPLPIRGGQTKEFRFEKLLSQSNGSSTIRNQRLTLEFTSNPAWYAVQALPYMMEYPYECAEQTFSRFYSNSIASSIANSSPKIKAVFEAWKSAGPDAFLSNLEKNQELKNVVLTETPWVLDAKDESERKRRVGLLFDLNRMANEQERCLQKLRQMQVSNGGWPWFDGMPDDRYITQYIITGFGHLDHLGVKSVRDDRRNWDMVTDGMHYLDNRMREDYDWILKYDKAHLNDDHLGYLAIQYLYARSFFPEISMTSRNKEAFDYFMGQSKKYWTGKGRYMQGMIALANFRYKDTKTANDVMKSLSETALHSEEMGMYWKENSGGWYWYQAPIETQALLIEAFKEVKNDTKSVDDMRVWLLKNKQTTDWKTTTATAQACYALLIDGTSWLATESDVTIVVGSQTIDTKKMDIKEEAGTGYFKTSWTGDAIKPEMGKVTVTKAGPGVSWGAMYWQYFEDLDKITPAQTPLQVTKKLFRVKNTSSGPVIEPITDATVLHPGDKIRVRIELKSDRDMEYVHMKDARASGFEPVNVLSQYKYQDGLGYYESTKDASTDFFFSYLPKGTHVFEYPLTVIHAGDFSNGITQVQCMYAPEFAAHSEGLRVKVAK